MTPELEAGESHFPAGLEYFLGTLLKTNMAGWKMPQFFVRTFIFMVDFPTNHVTFRGGKPYYRSICGGETGMDEAQLEL